MTTPFFPTPADVHAAQAQLDLLQRQELDVPPHLANLLRDLLGEIAAGRGVQVVSVRAEFTTQEAADILRVSRPYLVKLLEAGDVPFHRVGARRRLRQDDVMAYKKRLDAQRQQAIQALADDLQDMGLD